MKRSIISISLAFAVLFGTALTTAQATGGADETACPFTPEAGRTIITFDGGFILSNKTEAKAKSDPVSVSLPAGTYKVTLASFDNHANKPGQIQPKESWFVDLRGADGDAIASTPPIGDLPDSANSKTEVVAENFILPRAAASAVAMHAAYPDSNPNSITPVCATFDMVEEEEEKIEICHVPPGNPENKHTITISKSALQAHLNHGDSVGACEPDEEEEPLPDPCPFIAQEDRVIIRFNAPLLAHSSLTAAQSSPVSISLPAGAYTVTLASRDDHANKQGQVQPKESWFVKLFDANGNTIATTTPIGDLPDSADTITQTVDAGFVLTADAASAVAMHAAYPDSNPNSITAVCAAFDVAEEDEAENQKPLITVLGANPFEVTIGHAFTDPGATAFDEEDGNITDRIVIGGDTVATNTIGAYVITYNVKDSGDIAADEKTRTVHVVEEEEETDDDTGGSAPKPQCSDEADNDLDDLADEEDPGCHTDGDPDNEDSYDPNDDDENSKPAITLIGNATITITEDDNLTDPGATAFDQEDGDITEDIIPSDVVHTGSAGTYTVAYNVEDSDGAKADEVTRTVIVKAKETAPTNGGGSTTTTPTGGGGGGGGSKITLQITNEAITLNPDGAAVITWNTNLQATSQVLYDVASHGSTTTLPSQSAYFFRTATSTALVTTHSVTIYGLTASTTYYFRPVSARADEDAMGKELKIAPSATIAATTTPPAASTPITLGPCQEYLTDYIKLGWDNDPAQVRKLEAFLNVFEGFNLPVDGIYDQRDFDAVGDFQERYFDDILKPWGHTEHTGYVYYTTRKKINEIVCRRPFPLTAMQMDEVEEFREFLNSLRQQGITPEDAGVDIGAIGKAEDQKPDSKLATGEEEEKEETPEDANGTSTLEDILAQPTEPIGENGEERQALTARILDAMQDRSRLIGIILIVAALSIGGIGLWRSRSGTPEDVPPPSPPPLT